MAAEQAPQVAANRTRAVEIDGLDQPVDAREIVLRGECEEQAAPTPIAEPSAPSVLWEGSIEGDATGPQKSYFVRLYSDGTAHCQCPAFYFRGILKRDRGFACKHVGRARLRLEPRA